MTKYAGWSIMSLFFFLTVKSIAGTNTNLGFNVFIKYITDGGIKEYIELAISAGTSVWAIWERKLRQSKTKHLSTRITELENIIDPNRSSSQLQNTGKTRIGD